MATKQTPRAAARNARLIARQVMFGALATLRQGGGDGPKGPYVSKVGVTLDMAGAPLFLFSTLATHTQDLLADPRASLLVEGPAEDANNPLQSARATLVGKVERIDVQSDAAIRARYLTRHPSARTYAAFGDFSMWRMTVEKIHYVGGFGLSKWAKASDYLAPTPGLIKAEGKIIEHLEGILPNPFTPYIERETGRSANEWRIQALDSDGLDLIDSQNLGIRLNFKSSAEGLPDWHEHLDQLL